MIDVAVENAEALGTWNIDENHRRRWQWVLQALICGGVAQIPWIPKEDRTWGYVMVRMDFTGELMALVRDDKGRELWRRLGAPFSVVMQQIAQMTDEDMNTRVRRDMDAWRSGDSEGL